MNAEQGARRIDLFPRLNTERANEVIQKIHGANIERDLIDLARSGGKRIDPREGQPERYATFRLALSPADTEARQTIIEKQMREAGVDSIFEHPLATIGVIYGTGLNLNPLVVLSHTDTVPNGDMYDGTYGVESAIAAAKAIKEVVEQPRRTIMVISLTGEESAGFGIALFGSRALFKGLTDTELDSKSSRPGAKTIRETLLEQGVDIAQVQQSIFGDGRQFPKPYAVLELHVDQSGMLEQAKTDLGIVEAIASPERHRVTIGQENLQPDTTVYPYTRYVKLQVAGKADHSGATPMGAQRADGLVATANILGDILQQNAANFGVGAIEIQDQAINKIPGQTETTLRIIGNSEEEINKAYGVLTERIRKQNESYPNSETAFGQNPVSLQNLEPEQVTVPFYKPSEIAYSQVAAMRLISTVCEAANMNAAAHTVGTVGTVRMANGRFVLEVDVRGIERHARDKTIFQIRESVRQLNTRFGAHVDFGNPLPGSGDDPVTLDSHLVRLAEDTIEKMEIGSSMLCESAAGHDAQNAARADIPTVMLFVPSQDGIAHNPDAYTKPLDLEKGARALAALMVRLAA